MRTPSKPLPPVDVIEHHLTYSIITGEFYNNHNKCGRGGGVNDVAGSVYNTGRRMIKIDGVPYQASRLAWKVVYGVDPTHEIDHIDNDRDNNSIINLRDVPHSVNQLNRIDTKRNGGVWEGSERQKQRNNERSKKLYANMSREQKDKNNARARELRRQRRLKRDKGCT